MEKITSCLTLLFCFALVLFFPGLIFASVDLTAVVNATGGDGTFQFSAYGICPNCAAYPTDFSVSTQSGSGTRELTFDPNYQFVITQSLPDGWKMMDANCVDSATSTTPIQFTYAFGPSLGNVGVTLGSYDNSRIVCTYNVQYSDLFSNILYLNIDVAALGGDGTFTYTTLSDYGSYSNPADYQIGTINGHGSAAIPPRPFWFTIHQNVLDGWQPVSVFCKDDRNRATFNTFVNYGWSAVEIISNDPYRITCTFINQNLNPAKTPVLFVPGMLSTDLSQDANLIWANTDRIFQSISDDFMDPLSFQGNLLPDPNETSMSLAGVIQEKDFHGVLPFHYTDYLINEFRNQGYVTDEGRSGQNFFTFPYDWRYGVSGVLPDGTTNATLLRDKIRQILLQTGAQKVDVIAHSLGGLIVKKYVMDSANASIDPKIGKLVFVGVPNLGAPLAAQALLMGYDFRIFGLNSGEVKKICQNMPLAYDLLPTPAYFSSKGDYVNNANIFPFGSKLDYAATDALFRKTGLNGSGLNEAELLHTPAFDSYDVRSIGIDTYNIVGCKSPTLAGINYQYTDLGADGFSVWRDPISGDDTVPRESAASIATDSGKTFYALAPEHGKMPSAAGIRQKIVNIISGSSLDIGNRIFEKSQIDPKACELNGILLLVLSPVDVTVTDRQGNLLGIDSDGNIRRDIPGASFEVENGHKYLYLPTGDGETYTISVQGSPSLGTGSGTYTLIDEKIVDGQPAGAQIFKDQLVTAGFSGNLNLGGANPTIITGDGLTISPTFVVTGNALQDTLAPTTVATLNGTSGQAGFYRGDVTVNLSATDPAQSGVTSAGVDFISYSLDNATTTAAGLTASIPVSKAGNHTITYFAQDKMGNREAAKTNRFTIDKVSPEIKFNFDQNAKDLVFSASDNFSGGSITSLGNPVVATDAAGNTTQLGFVEKNRAQSLRAQVKGLTYGDGRKADTSNVQLAFAWFYGYTPAVPTALTGTLSLPTIPAALPKSNTLTFLLQQAKLKDGSFIVALYGGKNTLILEYKNKKMNLKTVAGLRLVKFSTSAGSFSWIY